MSTIRKTATMLATIGDGDFERELDAAMLDMNRALLAHIDGRKKVKAKGKITVTLAFEMIDGTLIISPDIAVKVPRIPRSTGFFWMTTDGELSTEHPEQIRMDFKGRAAAGDVVVAPTTALA